MTKIKFELEQTEKDKKLKERTDGRLIIYSKVNILKDGEIVGHIFSPSGSGNDVENAIQVCGFSEAFDLWGCGIFNGYKDIQLLFDDGIMGGKEHFNLTKCCRCYRNPCQCDNKIISKDRRKQIEGITKEEFPVPFNMKSSWDEEFKMRLEVKKKK